MSDSPGTKATEREGRTLSLARWPRGGGIHRETGGVALEGKLRFLVVTFG